MGYIKNLLNEHPMKAALVMFAAFLLALFFYHDSKVFWGLFVCFAAISGLIKHYKNF
ncbi:hypothetical protein D3C85_98600 [compost metagenome]